MIINNLKLYHFKNFEHLEVEPQPGVNLFVGSNGSGKTSILEAIRVALGGFFEKYSKLTDNRLILHEQVMITDGLRNDYSQIQAQSTSISGIWGREYSTRTNSNDKKTAQPVSSFGEILLTKIKTVEDRSMVPLIAYYSTQRLFKGKERSVKNIFDPALGRHNGYLSCLEENTIKPLLKDWLEKAVVLRASKQIQEIETTDLILSNIEDAIKIMVRELYALPPQFVLKIYPDSFHDNELFLAFNGQNALPLENYSDGFKNLSYLIIDLVWRASQLHPWLTLENLSNSITGIVLIDEIDLHLHPKWQGKAIDLLQKLFPKVQFFITTHSPTVVANFENGSLYIIDQNHVNKYSGPYFGLEINAILTDILGGTDRNIKIQDQINSVLILIDTNPADPSIQPKLDLLIKKLGVTDPQVQLALSLYTWAKENSQE
jgi:predicted ATP-binding protein involved in virulence